MVIVLSSNKKKRCFPKKLEGVRCPWCGERYDTRKGNKKPEEKDFNIDRFARYCHVCGKWGKEYTFTFNVLVVIAISIVVFLLIENTTAEFLVLLPFYLLLVGNQPVYRQKYDGTVLTPEEETLCYVNVRWYTLKEGGVGIPRLRIGNHRIMPICFVDKNDNPLTQVGCVRLCKRYFLFYQNMKIRQITDVIEKERIHKGDKFYIFNGGEKIGEGIVVGKEKK